MGFVFENVEGGAVLVGREKEGESCFVFGSGCIHTYRWHVELIA
jgi:hypothetical protein